MHRESPVVCLCKLRHHMGSLRGGFSGGPCILSWRMWYNDVLSPDPRTCSSFGGAPFRDGHAPAALAPTPDVVHPSYAYASLPRAPMHFVDSQPPSPIPVGHSSNFVSHIPSPDEGVLGRKPPSPFIPFVGPGPGGERSLVYGVCAGFKYKGNNDHNEKRENCPNPGIRPLTAPGSIERISFAETANAYACEYSSTDLYR